MTTFALYPFNRAINAKPKPVLPAVASTTVDPLVSSPFFSASSMILRATLSFIEDPGFMLSSFKYKLQ